MKLERSLHFIFNFLRFVLYFGFSFAYCTCTRYMYGICEVATGEVIDGSKVSMGSAVLVGNALLADPDFLDCVVILDPGIFILILLFVF